MARRKTRTAYAPIPVVGRLVAWLAAVLEARFVLWYDERILASSEPRASDLRSNKLVRADAGIGLWHKLFRRSQRDAGDSRARGGGGDW